MAIIIEIGIPNGFDVQTQEIAYIPTSQVFLNDIDDASETEFSTWSSAKIKAFIAEKIGEALANYAPSPPPPSPPPPSPPPPPPIVINLASATNALASSNSILASAAPSPPSSSVPNRASSTSVLASSSIILASAA